jgi:putative phosphoesterase
MRVAVLSDIHGNLPALTAVLRQVIGEEFDLIVSAGDVVSGPMPAESLDALSGCGIAVEWVMGNADRGVIDAFDARAVPGTPLDDVHPVDIFAASRISEEQRALLGTFQPVVELGDTLVCHGSPHSFNDVVTLRSPPSRLQPFVEGVDAQVVIGGHVHHQFTTNAAGRLWVNAGSVGMPYEGSPGAYWLAVDKDGPEHRRTEYDIGDALVQIAQTSYPAYDELSMILRGEITAADAASAFEPGE